MVTCVPKSLALWAEACAAMGNTVIPAGPPERDGAGQPIEIRFLLATRLGPKLLRIMREREGGTPVLVPDYIPNSWLNRLKLEIDAMGQPHFLWTGWNNGEGHGKYRDGKKIRYTHRTVVEKVRGIVLSRWQYVDHIAEICGRKRCCNYDHLEPVTPGVNTARGPGAETQFKPVWGYGESLDAIG
jgi:hypothetical protein